MHHPVRPDLANRICRSVQQRNSRSIVVPHRYSYR